MPRYRAVPSTAAIGGHPIHPIIVPFPIAFLIGAFAADVMYVTGADMFWVRASIWLLIAGIVMGLFAGIFGLIDFLSHREIRSHSAAWVHMIGNLIVILLAAWNLALRLQIAPDSALEDNMSPSAIDDIGIYLSGIIVVMLLITGWLGGELAYRYRIGVVPQQPADFAAQEELDQIHGSQGPVR